MTEREAYRILGLSPGADGAELKRTYRRLMMQAHPDAGKDAVPDRARELNLAYAVLKGAAVPGKKAPSRASAERDPDPQKNAGWDAPLNPNAYAGREILCYAEDQDGAPLGSFPIAKGKYLWRVEEDFPLFLLSIYRCSREILDEADAALNRVSPPSREGIHAQLAYLLAQQFIDGTALLPRLAKNALRIVLESLSSAFPPCWSPPERPPFFRRRNRCIPPRSDGIASMSNKNRERKPAIFPFPMIVYIMWSFPFWNSEGSASAFRPLPTRPAPKTEGETGDSA